MKMRASRHRLSPVKPGIRKGGRDATNDDGKKTLNLYRGRVMSAYGNSVRNVNILCKQIPLKTDFVLNNALDVNLLNNILSAEPSLCLYPD